MGFPPLLLASDYGPTASFYASPSSGSTSTVFTFNAGASENERGFSNGLEYQWTFDYGAENVDETWSTSTTTTHEYDTSGEKTILLEVRDENGLTDEMIIGIDIWETESFYSWFNVSPWDGDTNTVFTFQADVSTRGSVSDEGFQFRWDFDNDGEWDTDFSESMTEYHTYPDTGFYNPKMEALSPDGVTLLVIGFEDNSNDLTYLYVTFGQAPSASIDVFPSDGTTSTVFYFDGSKSFDSQDHGDIDIRWDLEGDGLFEYDWGSEESPSTTYSTPGTYNPIIQIRDSDGNVDEAYTSVTVEAGDLPPEAKLTVSSDSGLTDKTVGTTSTTFSFSASSSSDEEDYTSALQVRWDWEGDGEWDTLYDTSKTAEHRYLDSGTYTVTMEVVDTSNQTDTTTATVSVVENDAPVPDLSVSPTIGTPGTTFSFDASDSEDSQYNVTSLEVRWDWEGDSVWDTAFEVDKTVTHQYESPGTYTATMQLRDPEGQTSEATQTILVQESTAPVAILTSDESSGTFSTLFHFDASTSYDNETDASDLYFRWDYNYTGENDILYDTAWGRSTTKSKYFDQTGDVTVRVEVKDEDGQISIDYLTVSLHWASDYLDYLKDRGIISGYSGGDLAPDQQVTRAELLKMVMEAIDVNKYGHTHQDYFSDVSNTDWFDTYVELAYEMEIADGYSDGQFKPNDPINRAEAMKIILNGFEVDLESYDSGTFPDVNSSDWFADFVGTAHEYGLVSGYPDGYFKPGNYLTRGEASKIIALAMEGL